MLKMINEVMLRGVIEGLPEPSHMEQGLSYWRFPLSSKRLSGQADTLFVLLSDPPEFIKPQVRLEVSGRIHTRNQHTQTGSKLIISVLAKQIVPTEYPDCNQAFVIGRLCKPPVFRLTPAGREICDLLLAVHSPDETCSYLPCIVWGSLAREMAEVPAGSALKLSGRLQSRLYTKKRAEGEEIRTAFELSANHAKLLTLPRRQVKLS